MRCQNLLLFGLILLSSRSAQAQLELLRDINAQPSPTGFPEHFTVYENGYLFTLHDQELGRELWISDGTEADTRLVHDIHPSGDAFQGAEPCFVVLDGVAYFFAHNDRHGLELWRSDGTTHGTWLVKDVRAGNLDGAGSELVVSGGKLFFPGRADATGWELWVSDGTEAGTSMVMDIMPGGGSSNPRSLVDFNGTLMFEANNGTHGYELWRSDGLPDGLTERVTDLNLSGSSDVHSLTASGEALFFLADPGSGTALYRMDESFTPAVVPGFATGTGYIGEMAGFGDGRLLLTWMDAGTWESEPWVTDGTTHVELEIAPDGSASVSDLFQADGIIFFSATDGTSGAEPYRTDGTLAGTFRIQDINPSGGSYPTGFVTDGDHVYFLAYDGTNGTEIWKTDGEVGSASLAVDLTPGPNSSNIEWMVASGSGLAFSYDDWDLGGIYPSFSDGTTEGTAVLTPNGPITLGSGSHGFQRVGDNTIFLANDGTHGYELWATDGTSTGTILLQDIMPGPEPGAYNLDGGSINGRYCFCGELDEEGSELFRTAGTPGSTALVYSSGNSSENGCLGSFFELNDALFYSATHEDHGAELWRTDGTLENTNLFLDAVPGQAGSDIRYSATVGEVAVLTAKNGSGVGTLWRTDGTTAGSFELATFGTAPINSIGTAQGLHFFYTCNDWPCQVWQTDGSAEGTTPCSFLQPFGSTIRNFTPFATGAVFFVEYEQGSGKGFFYWDGGTTVTSVYDGSAFSNTFNYGHAVLGGKVAAVTVTPGGVELVVMDPIALAVDIIEIHPGPGSGSFGPLVEHDGVLYFEGTDGSSAYKLWRSDGTVAGTYPVTKAGEIHAITAFQSTPDGLLIAGTSTSHGRELFSYQPQGRLALKGVLRGAYDNGSGMMRDALRTGGTLPQEEPYTAMGMTAPGEGGARLQNGVLDSDGGDAIVDWVLVELRDGTSPELVLEARPALIQRDGDVVDTDGRSPLVIGVQNGTYHIALRHRNHMGVMARDPLTFGASPTVVDLSDPTTIKYGTGATATVEGRHMLWPGNVVADEQVKYTGLNNDRDPILAAIGGVVPTNVVHGYRMEDVNLDGSVKYTGSNNDRDLILQSIGGSVPTNTLNEQLP